jgi:hypothetical protein
MLPPCPSEIPPGRRALSKSPKNWCAAALAEHSDAIMLVAISVSHLESHWDAQLELPLDLADEKRRPGTKKRMVRFTVSRTRRERPLTSKRGPPNAQTERPSFCERCPAAASPCDTMVADICSLGAGKSPQRHRQDVNCLDAGTLVLS